MRDKLDSQAPDSLCRVCGSLWAEKCRAFCIPESSGEAERRTRCGVTLCCNPLVLKDLAGMAYIASRAGWNSRLN